MTGVTMTIDEARTALTARGAPYEVVTRTIHGVEYRVFAGGPRNLRELYESCIANGDKTFLVYLEERYSFREVYGQAATIAHRLIERCGIRPADRVAIAMRNYPEWITSYMAVTSIGAVAVTLNAWWLGEELRYGLANSGAKVVLVDEQRLEYLAPLLPELDLQVIAVRTAHELPAKAISYEAFIGGHHYDEMPAVRVDADQDAVIMYTSGSTGNPKGALSTHRAILSSLLSWEFGGAAMAMVNPAVAAGASTNQPAALLTLPLFHVTGCHSQFLSCFRAGRKLVMMYKWDPDVAVQLIEAEKISVFSGVPTMAWELLESPEIKRRDISSLVSIGGGGAPRPPEQVRRIAEEVPGRMPGTGYGLTETNAVGTTIGGLVYLERPASVGKATPPLVDVKIVDDEGRDLPIGETGEIWIKGPVNIRCYWNDEEATSKAFTDGWFHTGDIGRLDDEEFLYITDRAKDIVIRGGENIGCAEVEAAIYEHPAVYETSVFGVPDARFGEVVAAVVMVKPGKRVTEQELKRHVGERLARFKVPAYIFVQTEQLPRVASGKIYKKGIREQVIEKLRESVAG